MSSWANQNKLFISLSPVQILTLCAYGEAGRESSTGISAVLQVIKNRADDPAKYADQEILRLSTVWHGVILKSKQFSCFNIGDPGREKLLRLAEMWDIAIKDNAYVQKCYALALQLLKGQLANPVGAATYYHANYVTPAWATQLAYLGKIGAHLFYTDTDTGLRSTGTGTNRATGTDIEADTTSVLPGWAILFLLSGLFYYFFQKGH